MSHNARYLTSDGDHLVNRAGQGVGPDGIALRCTITGTSSMVLKKNTAPPGAAVSLTSIAYLDASFAAQSAGTAITATGTAYVSREDATSNLYAVLDWTSGNVLVQVTTASLGGPEGAIAAADIAAGTFGANTGATGTYTAPGALNATTMAATGGFTGNVTGNASGSAATVTTAAQPAITSVGTLTSLAVTGAVTGGSFRSASPTGGIGYAAGAGGAQTQATSKATTVVSNTITTAITMTADALAALTAVSFTFTNSAIAATDSVIVTHQSAGTSAAYTCNAFPAAGSAVISVRNNTAGILSEAIVLRVTVIKSVSA